MPFKYTISDADTGFSVIRNDNGIRVSNSFFKASFFDINEIEEVCRYIEQTGRKVVVGGPFVPFNSGGE